MNGGLLWTLIIAPAALLAAWLFLSVSDQQHDDYKVDKAKTEISKAEFDTEFKAALGGKSDPALDARVVEARADLDKIKVKQAEKEAKAKAERDKMQSEIKDLFIDDQPVKKP